MDQQFQQIQIPQIDLYILLKFGQSWCQNKCTPLKKIEKNKSRISSLFFILKKNKKSGILFLPFFKFPASFSKIG